MNNKFKQVIVIIFVVIATIMSPLRSVYAQQAETEKTLSLKIPDLPELKPGEKNVGPAISPIKIGQAAPFSGVLFSPVAVATILSEFNALNGLMQLNVKKEQETQIAICSAEKNKLNIQSEADKNILNARLDSKTRELQLLNDQLAKQENNSPNAPLLIGVSFSVGVLSTISLVAVLLNSTR